MSLFPLSFLHNIRGCRRLSANIIKLLHSLFCLLRSRNAQLAVILPSSRFQRCILSNLHLLEGRVGCLGNPENRNSVSFLEKYAAYVTTFHFLFVSQSGFRVLSAILFVRYSKPSFIKSLALGLWVWLARREYRIRARVGVSSATRNDVVVAYDAASYVADCNLVTRWRTFKSGYNAVNLRSWCRTVAPVLLPVLSRVIRDWLSRDESYCRCYVKW